MPQKLVTRLSPGEAVTDPSVPASIRKIARGEENAELTEVVEQDGVNWEIKKYADGSNNSYLLRTNLTAGETDRNKYQYFIGNRYLPGAGKVVI